MTGLESSCLPGSQTSISGLLPQPLAHVQRLTPEAVPSIFVHLWELGSNVQESMVLMKGLTSCIKAKVTSLTQAPLLYDASVCCIWKLPIQELQLKKKVLCSETQDTQH